MLPTPMQPMLGRSFAESLANAFWLQLKYGTALAPAAARADCLRKLRRLMGVVFMMESFSVACKTWHGRQGGDGPVSTTQAGGHYGAS